MACIADAITAFPNDESVKRTVKMVGRVVTKKVALFEQALYNYNITTTSSTPPKKKRGADT